MSVETIETVIIQGEAITASLLVWRRFRKPMPGLVERVLDINPGLADAGVFLPLGAAVKIPIPVARPAPEVTPIRLWG